MFKEFDMSLHAVRCSIVWLVLCPFEEVPRAQRELEIVSKKGYFIHIVDATNAVSKKNEIEGQNCSFHHIKMPKMKSSEQGGILYFCKSFLHYLHYYLSAFVLLLSLQRKSKIIGIHCFHLYTLPLGVAFKKILKCQLIYDAYEFSYFYFKRYVPGILVPFLCRIEGKLSHKADLVLTWWKTQDKFFQKYYGLRTTIFPNLLPPRFVKKPFSFNREREKLGVSLHDFVVLFAGSMLPRQYRLFELLDAAKILKSSSHVTNIKLLFASADPADPVKAYARKIGIYEHCKFLGNVPYNEISKLCLVSDVVYAEVEPTLNQLVLPSAKIFEAMLCKKPVITCHIGEKSKLVNKAKCGLTIKPEVEEIAKALLKFVENKKMRLRMGINGYEYYVKNYSWEKYSRIFLSAYEKILFPKSIK